jgi:hypothetical protein
VGKHDAERLLKRLRCKWGENIKIDLKEIGWVLIGFIWLRIK